MIVLILFSFLVSSAEAAEFGAIVPNNEGVLSLVKENPYQAYMKFVEALAEDPFDPTIRLNLGVAFGANKENEKALAEFKQAEEYAGDNLEIKFMARFNQGVMLSAMGDVPGALKAYQAALDINPTSVEVKTNIELLWQNQGGKGGGGKSDKKNQDKNDQGEGGENEDQKDKEPKDDQGQEKENQQKQPKPFDSKDLTPDTVKKILEELKAQEQRVRAEHYGKGAKERPRDKNW